MSLFRVQDMTFKQLSTRSLCVVFSSILNRRSRHLCSSMRNSRKEGWSSRMGKSGSFGTSNTERRRPNVASIFHIGTSSSLARASVEREPNRIAMGPIICLNRLLSSGLSCSLQFMLTEYSRILAYISSSIGVDDWLGALLLRTRQRRSSGDQFGSLINRHTVAA